MICPILRDECVEKDCVWWVADCVGIVDCSINNIAQALGIPHE
jgi:hypothetical protein